MTDLKALRREIAKKAYQDGHTMGSIEAIESAMLQYAEACLGKPSEGMIDAGAFANTAKAAWGTMASQRLKEIK